jgi:Type I phosphodiesterase / nucleotide pyrophosphatase
VDGGISHSGPWDYVQRVPMLLYGPGYVEPAGVVRRPVTMADLPATYAELLGFDFQTPDGRPMTEALLSESERPTPPALIFTLVWDAAGRNVLDLWPDQWPILRGLIEDGAWYENAIVGSSPSVTPPIHATMGTGAFPRTHGVTDNQVRVDGQVVGAWAQGPAFLKVPTLADEYDRAMGNQPLVGGVATLTWHLSMVGHGAALEGGDRDIAVLRQKADDEGAEAEEWNLPANVADFFSFPTYVNDLTPLADYARALDQEDGALDGEWRGHSIDELRGGFHTPARVPYETEVIREVLGREGFGDDDMSDLFYANYKIIDEVGHADTMNSPEMSDTVKAQDEGLGELIDILNEEVGEGRWVIAVTADHGHTPDPEVSGAFRISVARIEEQITAAFDDDDDRPVLARVRPTQIYLDTTELEENGFTLDQVAEFVAELTEEQTARNPDNVDPATADRNVFAAAFPTQILDDLPCLPEEAKAAG